MANNGLADEFGSCQPVNQVERVLYFAVQLRVARAQKFTKSADRSSFENVGAIARFGNQLLRVFQWLVVPVSTEIVKHFERKTQRVHVLVTFPAFIVLRDTFNALAKCPVRIIRNLCVDSDWHVGDVTRQKFFADPATTSDRISVEV